MSLISIEITGLRSFGSTQRLELAIPNGKAGSGLTFLVGPNNGGKSTIIEAFAAITQQNNISFTEGKRNKKAGDRVIVRTTHSSGEVKELQTVSNGGSETSWNDPKLQPTFSSIFVLPSRRTFSPFFGKGLSKREDYITNYTLPSLRSSSIDRFHHRLFAIQENRADFDKVLSKVLDPIPTWY
jgi:energy-coupling factor transporter ATP-binding protein EcfA2